MTEEQMNLEGQPIDIPIVGAMELPQLDVSKYVGRKTVIDKVETYPGKFGYFLKVSTKVLDAHPVDQNNKPVKDKDGNPIELRATRILGLSVNKAEDGSEIVGWGEKSKTGLFMARHNAKTPKDLVGMGVQVISVTSDKDGRDYLTFN